MKTQKQISKEAKKIMEAKKISKLKIGRNTGITYHTITNFLECNNDSKMSTCVEIMNYLYAMDKETE